VDALDCFEGAKAAAVLARRARAATVFMVTKLDTVLGVRNAASSSHDEAAEDYLQHRDLKIACAPESCIIESSSVTESPNIYELQH
jgi:hypothetical protein